MTRTPKLYRELFGREVPADLLTPINDYKLGRDNPLAPLRQVIEAELERRAALLRDFIGVRSEDEVLPALKKALFGGFTVIEGNHPRYKHDEAVQIDAKLATGIGPTAAARVIEQRRKRWGDGRPFKTILRDYQEAVGNAKNVFGPKGSARFSLIHSGILAPLQAYGAQHPGVRLFQLVYWEGRNGYSFSDMANLGLILKIALQCKGPDNAEYFTAGLLAGARNEILAEMGADVVLVDSPASGFPLRPLLQAIGLTVTALHNEGPLAEIPAPSVFVMVEEVPAGVSKSVDDFLDKRFRNQSPEPYNHFKWLARKTP